MWRASKEGFEGSDIFGVHRPFLFFMAGLGLGNLSLGLGCCTACDGLGFRVLR